MQQTWDFQAREREKYPDAPQAAKGLLPCLTWKDPRLLQAPASQSDISAWGLDPSITCNDLQQAEALFHLVFSVWGLDPGNTYNDEWQTEEMIPGMGSGLRIFVMLSRHAFVVSNMLMVGHVSMVGVELMAGNALMVKMALKARSALMVRNKFMRRNVLFVGSVLMVECADSTEWIVGGESSRGGECADGTEDGKIVKFKFEFYSLLCEKEMTRSATNSVMLNLQHFRNVSQHVERKECVTAYWT